MLRTAREGVATHVLIVCREALRSTFERLIGQLDRSADPPLAGGRNGGGKIATIPTSLSTETRLFELAWSDRQRSFANQSKREDCVEKRKDIIIEKRGLVFWEIVWRRIVGGRLVCLDAGYFIADYVFMLSVYVCLFGEIAVCCSCRDTFP